MSIGFLHSEAIGRDSRAGDGRVSVLPRGGTLAGFPLEDVWAEGVAIESLDAGTSLNVRTRHSEYRLKVLDGARREVLAQGGLPFPENTQACFEGVNCTRQRLEDRLARAWFANGSIDRPAKDFHVAGAVDHD